MMSIYLKFPEWRGKVLTFSYDDGTIHDKRLKKIFDKYGLRATFNLTTQYLTDHSMEKDWWKPMTLEEAKELFKDSEYEIALHSHTHPFPHVIREDCMTAEIIRNREILEKEFGGVITGMAYPQGTYNSETLEALRAAGVSYSRATMSTHNFNYPPKNWLELDPTCHHKDAEIFNLAEKFLSLDYSQAATNIMFYIWGHSYEFENDNNWEHMEKLCETLSGHDDIWYATNIEIYNYQKAFELLRCSLDGHYIFNPTSTDIWIIRAKNIFEYENIMIPAGEAFSD